MKLAGTLAARLSLAHLREWVRATAVTRGGHGDASRPSAGYRTRRLVLAATRSTYCDHPDIRALAEAVAGFTAVSGYRLTREPEAAGPGVAVAVATDDPEWASA